MPNGKNSGGLWHALREHATHWAIGGVLLAATGFAPQEWLARTVEHLHIPDNALHNAAANQQARNLFQRAIEQDPMFAAAYSRLTRNETHAFVYHQSIPLDAAAHAASMHARKAVELDPTDADGHASLASTLHPVMAALDPAIARPRQFTNDAVPISNCRMGLAESDPAVTGLVAFAVRQQPGPLV